MVDKAQKLELGIKESNAEIIELAARDAATQIVTVPLLKIDKKYVVMSAEQVEKTDAPLNSLIEDCIISSLAKGGFSVYERDKDILVRLAYQEGADKLKSFTLPPSSSTNISELPKYDIDYGQKAQIVPSKVTEKLGTDGLDAADCVISYRVLESGVKYYKINENDEAGYTQVKRIALVKLHIRIIDSKSGKIIWADTLSGVAEDLVSRQLVKYLEKTGYKFYPHTLPLQK